MKKLTIAMASLCLIVSASSCTADDLDENLILDEIHIQEIVNSESQSSSIDNGDKDKDKSGDDKKD